MFALGQEVKLIPFSHRQRVTHSWSPSSGWPGMNLSWLHHQSKNMNNSIKIPEIKKKKSQRYKAMHINIFWGESMTHKVHFIKNHPIIDVKMMSYSVLMADKT